jgi:hypothetical protein
LMDLNPSAAGSLGVQTDSGAHEGIGSAGAAQARSCQAEKGVVERVTREPLLSTELRAFPPGNQAF